MANSNIKQQWASERVSERVVSFNSLSQTADTQEMITTAAGRPSHAHEGRSPKIDWWGRNGASQLISSIWVLHFSKNLSFSDSSGDSFRYQ